MFFILKSEGETLLCNLELMVTRVASAVTVPTSLCEVFMAPTLIFSWQTFTLLSTCLSPPPNLVVAFYLQPLLLLCFFYCTFKIDCIVSCDSAVFNLLYADLSGTQKARKDISSRIIIIKKRTFCVYGCLDFSLLSWKQRCQQDFLGTLHYMWNESSASLAKEVTDLHKIYIHTISYAVLCPFIGVWDEPPNNTARTTCKSSDVWQMEAWFNYSLI